MQACDWRIEEVSICPPRSAFFPVSFFFKILFWLFFNKIEKKNRNDENDQQKKQF